MILLVSDNNEFNNFSLPLLEALGYIVFHTDKAHAVSTAKKYSISSVLIFADKNTATASRFCVKLRKELGNIKILTAVFKKPDSDSVYLEIPECNRQVILPCSADDFKLAVTRCFGSLISIGDFEINGGRKNITLLGYKLSLSKHEYIILRLLASTHPIILKDAFIRKFLGGISKNGLSVHICKINKKAALITGRHLIVRKDGNYCLNPFYSA